MASVPRVNPLQTAIASDSGFEDSPYQEGSLKQVSSDLGCSIGTHVTQVTRVAQSKSANKRGSMLSHCFCDCATDTVGVTVSIVSGKYNAISRTVIHENIALLGFCPNALCYLSNTYSLQFARTL